VDPLTRKNTGTNTEKNIPVLPKGFGSENNNALKMAITALDVKN